MSKKFHDLKIEKEIKKLAVNQNRISNNKKNVNKIINPRNKESFPNNKRNRIQINTKEEVLIERKSFNNELNQNKKIEQEENIENYPKNNNNEDNNIEYDDNNDKYFLDENDTKEKPPNAIEISDLIGEKCSIELDILSINFNNYESSKTSSKTMGQIKAYGVNTYQGLVRNYNEDRVSIIINMAKPKNYTKSYWPKTSFFGIYDGHGGNQCSEFLRDSLHKLILNDNNYPENVELAIKNGFKNAEKNFFSNFALDPIDNNNILDRSGSCAIVILFVDNIVYIANVGDSRALFSENNGKRYIEITEDHKPNNPREKKRVIKNGGHVYQSQTVINGAEKESLNGQILFGPYRVLPGRLSVSRTIGDIEAKNEKFGGNPNVIICEPDIFIYDLKKEKIDFFIMGCDGIFDQMSNEEIMDCAWMILKNGNKNNDNNNENINDNNEDDENIEYNFENCNIHEKCGIIVDFIIKSSMVRKSFDNVTCLMIALSDFINTEEKHIGNIYISENNNDLNDLNNQIISKPKNSTQLINRRKDEIVKPKEVKISDNHINNSLNNNKDIQKNSVKENIRLVNFMNAKNNKLNNENIPKTYRNTRTELKSKNNYNTNTNLLSNNKIYIKKRKERNLQKKKTNKTEITLNGESSKIVIKKILNKSEFQEGRKTDINTNKINEKNKNLNMSQNQNEINNPYISPINSKTNDISYNNNLIHKLRHNKINKIPFQLNNQIINNTNKTNINNINVHFHYSNTGPNNFKKITNIKNSSIGNISNTNSNISHTILATIPNNTENTKKLKNFTKPKTFRYSNNGLYGYRNTGNKNNIYNGEKTHYNCNTHNISENNNYLSSHNYSNNIGIKYKNRGSMSSRKKKSSYHHIIKTLSLNVDNNIQSKFKQLSNKKISYSKEKDIQNFLYKNKTNIKKGQYNDMNKKINTSHKTTMKSGSNNKIKKIY